jgi:hypothetical protein
VFARTRVRFPASPLVFQDRYELFVNNYSSGGGGFFSDGFGQKAASQILGSEEADKGPGISS